MPVVVFVVVAMLLFNLERQLWCSSDEQPTSGGETLQKKSLKVLHWLLF